MHKGQFQAKFPCCEVKGKQDCGDRQLSEDPRIGPDLFRRRWSELWKAETPRGAAVVVRRKWTSAGRGMQALAVVCAVLVRHVERLGSDQAARPENIRP